MFNNMFQILSEQQRADGAVDHPEFDVSHGIGAVKLSDDERQNLEAFVTSNTTEAHKYVDRSGGRGIVYFDRRGRGAMCVVENLPDEELLWIAQSKGWKRPANPDAGDKGGGYVCPVEESESLKSRRSLFDDLKLLTDKKGIRINLPSSHRGLASKVYGEEACVYVRWGSPQDKMAGEFELTGMGHKIKEYGSESTSSVRVSGTKGQHWDEDDEAETDRVLAEARGVSEEIQIINPYAAGMWVIRFEDFLYRITKKKWKWKKPILKRGNEMRYKWVWARKKRGSMFSPIIELKIYYDEGRDLFDVTVTRYDDSMEKIQEKRMRGVGIESVTDPSKMLGWMSGS